ncbi:PAS domain-containing protein [Roseiarcus fermentans]|uniref:histidine kinase n=1 Tax=Roseiarcus fermentans TaxID=1473586 RepID=A0A366FP86_9HYPH|nr:hybrid sensor histidine kinase/response regulator [Roseiarcus fermentans]RBP15529.1 PAS domain-containing protein [Roseiarcus fermentans]
MANLDPHNVCALIFAPHGRDSGIAQALLRQSDIESSICPDFAAFERALGETVSFVVATEEALQSCDLGIVTARLRNQPPWSDLPIVVLTQRRFDAEPGPGTERLANILGNLTFLERPFRAATFKSVARTAYKARQRQFEARTRIEELREGEERLRMALIAGRLGSWELRLPGRALIAGESCRAVLGLESEGPLSADDLLAVVDRDDRGRVAQAFRAAIETGDDLAIEYRRVSGERHHWAELRARLARDRNGGSRLVGVASDITVRKQAETVLRQVNETLERRVSERTAQLEQAHAAVVAEMEQRRRAEAQLRQSQKMEAIGQLTGGLAHDFNNLLTAIMSNLELLQKKCSGDDPTFRRLVEGAMQGARRGASVTQRLLAFARQQTLELEPRNLRELIQGMTDLIERSIGPQIELRLDYPPTPPVALVDANQIELAVLNLVLNARDAMPGGGVLTISVSEPTAESGDELAAGRYVRLTVSDTGHGMSAETLAKAVDPFFSTKGVGKGTGLGLSMVHGLAVQLKGALRIFSEVDRGTRAELWLPESSAAGRTATPCVSGEERTESDKIRILVVDDDSLIASSTADMLMDLGHSVIEAGSGAQALDILEGDEDIDLLFTDYSMPKMNGVELAKAALGVRPRLAVVMATGYADLPEFSQLSFGRINKPYLQSQLAAEIARALNAQRGRVREA